MLRKGKQYYSGESWVWYNCAICDLKLEQLNQVNEGVIKQDWHVTYYFDHLCCQFDNSWLSLKKFVDISGIIQTLEKLISKDNRNVEAQRKSRENQLQRFMIILEMNNLKMFFLKKNISSHLIETD